MVLNITTVEIKISITVYKVQTGVFKIRTATYTFIGGVYTFLKAIYSFTAVEIDSFYPLYKPNYPKSYGYIQQGFHASGGFGFNCKVFLYIWLGSLIERFENKFPTCVKPRDVSSNATTEPEKTEN